MKVKEVLDYLSNCDYDGEFILKDSNGNKFIPDKLTTGSYTYLDDKSSMYMATNYVYVNFENKEHV